MTPSFDRRAVLRLIAAAGLLPALPTGAAAQAADRLGPPQPFSFDRLAERARAAAARPYSPPTPIAPDVLDRIDYDAHWRIKFRDALSLPVEEDAKAQFFHLGRYARDPVALNLVEEGQARRILYTPDWFRTPDDSPARKLPEDAGFAGLRIMRPELEPDWISFLGASYFRCDGPERQYGLSARGLAVNTGLATPEEFPRFTEFWLSAGERPGETVVIHALLDGPSATGAYRIGAHRDAAHGQRCDVSTRLFFRESVERLGVAPLTSMYWYSQRDRRGAPDWRPEVHDSDGLAIANGAGERLWRPLRNAPRLTAASFFDENPRGFGLIQRDRRFESYQDDGVFYDRRPSAWIAPKGDWGRGAVTLIEIPTHDEIFDNIVAFWTPERAPAAGEALSFDYTLDWRERDPAPEGLARVRDSWMGWGGVPGQPRPEGVRKLAIDFAGGPLEGLEEGAEPEVEAQGGRISRLSARPVARHDGWRLMFDLHGAEAQPVELRARLVRNGRPLTETFTLLAEFAPG